MDDDELVDLLDDARTARALASRRGRRVLGQAAAQSGRLASAFVDLAEAGATAVVRTSAGTTATGVISAVGSDVVMVGDRWVRLSAVTVVRPTSLPASAIGAAASGDRTAHGATMLELLAGLVDDQPVLQLAVVGGDRVSGRLLAVGVDVVTLAGEQGSPCYVSADSIVEVFRSG